MENAWNSHGINLLWTWKHFTLFQRKNLLFSRTYSNGVKDPYFHVLNVILVTALWSCSSNEQPAEKANCNSKNNSRNNNHGGNSSNSPLGVFLIKGLLYFRVCFFGIFGEFLPGILNIPLEVFLVLAFSISHIKVFFGTCDNFGLFSTKDCVRLDTKF